MCTYCTFVVFWYYDFSDSESTSCVPCYNLQHKKNLATFIFCILSIVVRSKSQSTDKERFELWKMSVHEMSWKSGFGSMLMVITQSYCLTIELQNLVGNSKWVETCVSCLYCYCAWLIYAAISAIYTRRN